MSRLSALHHVSQEIAEAITAALAIEVEIIDDTLTIVAGTGRYKEKIGQQEEEGDIESGYTYSLVLRTGKAYIIEDARNDPVYDARESELAEVCCPIFLDRQVIGLIGLVAFNEQQRDLLLQNKENLLLFLKRMAFLLASKVSEKKIATELTIIVETIRDGIIAVDRDGTITSSNQMAEKLIGKPRTELIGKKLVSFWPDSPVMDVIESGVECRDREEIYRNHTGKPMHVFTTICPILHGDEKAGTGNGRAAFGAVVSFRDMADVRRMVYDMTEKREDASFLEIIGKSKSIREVVDQGEKISQSNSTVLITGESGTGKGLFARSIHSASPRKNRPFIAVNCGAIPDSLLESELFGYESGAFTGARKTGKAGKFELANGGTIFLDEIGDLPLHLQVKLLHVLQSREIERVGGTTVFPVDVRVIAATNRNLERMIQDGEFREDLYFRLNVIPIHIPPLRERREDIPILLEYALRKYVQMFDKQITWFDDATLDLLTSYHWPGNIRELENVVEYAVNIENSQVITMQSVPIRLRRIQEAQMTEGAPLTLKKQLDAVEKGLIENCLNRTGYSVEGKTKAAHLLGISESTLYRRIRELNIDKKGQR
ncbi:sigma-54-dependent Fis family transcriptional regulator [Ferviditalea candida]|uniref:Sigma 54-interacting transcriptional regulator n=1 Tax=Ferviditalea candida TaxID=3108399 RepID=A0ABU5ZE98_9BACL|nr:sigma 54-interacting transcriptional regulator [Paenibacillaceae bacterium T2]